jgi:hypothetical protein
MAPVYIAGEKPQASPPARKKAPKALAHLRISPAENGGHVVEHHFTHYDHEPEQHVFGKGQGHEMLAHVAQHMGVTDREEEGDDE